MLKLKSYEIENYLSGKGLTFRRRGRKAECKICPFCKGGDAGDKYTFVVYLDETGGNFKCMRGKCAQSGSFWQLAEHFGDNPKEFYEKRDFAPKAQSESVIVPELKPAITFSSEPVEPQKLTPEAIEYLSKRGFDAEVLDELPIWCDEQGNVNFGYYHEGELCMVKARKPAKPAQGERKAWQKWKGGLRTLWGLELCDFSKPYIIITFGEYDAVALRQARIENAVSVPCGDTDLEWINICYDRLKELSEIYLWIDNDESGAKALPQIAARLGARKIKVIRSPYKDANEMLVKEARKHNDATTAAEAVYEAVHSAEWYCKGDVLQFAEISDDGINFNGTKTGIEILDKFLGGALSGRLTLISGSKKNGKSSLINQIVAQTVAQNTPVCVYAGEDELKTYKFNMQVHIAGHDGITMKTSVAGAEYSEAKAEYKQLINDWTYNRLFVISRRSGLNEETILDNFRLAFERYGCRVFVVDNLMKLVASKDTNNLNFRQTQVVNKLSDFAKETDAHIFLIVHTNKEDTELKPPKSSNEVAGAKEIVNLCDSCVNIWRIPDELKPDYENADAVVSILDNRIFGIKATANLIYDWRVRRYAANNYEMLQAKYHLENLEI